MYIGLAHTGVGAAILTIVALGSFISGLIAKRAARRSARRGGGQS